MTCATDEPSRAGDRTALWIALLCFLAGCGVYAVSLRATLIYDDVALFRDRRTTMPGQWWAYWRESYNGGIDNLYRPLVSMSYVIQYRIWGESAWAYHAANVLMHGLVSALVALLTFRLLKRSRRALASLIAGLIFAVHPIHAEAVAGIVGRAELMCAAGFLGALVLLLKPITTPRAIGVWLCGIVSLLSKEQGMLLLPISLFMLWCIRGETRVKPRSETGQPKMSDAENADRQLLSCDAQRTTRNSQKTTAQLLFLASCLTLAGYIVFRESILKFWWDRTQLDWNIQPLVRSPSFDRVLLPVSLLGRYVQLLMFPARLCIDYGGPAIGYRVQFGDPYLYLGALSIVAWIVVAIVAWKRRDSFTLSCLFALAMTYGVVGNVISLIGTIFGERLMYLPSVFFVMIAARWLSLLEFPRVLAARGGRSSDERSLQTSGPALAITLLIFAAASWRTVSYVSLWSDRLTLYRYCETVQPKSTSLSMLIDEECRRTGRPDEAWYWANHAAELSPDYEKSWYRLASLCIDRGEFDLAKQHLQRGFKIRFTGDDLIVSEKLRNARAATQPSAQP